MDDTAPTAQKRSVLGSFPNTDAQGNVVGSPQLNWLSRGSVPIGGDKASRSRPCTPRVGETTSTSSLGTGPSETAPTGAAHPTAMDLQDDPILFELDSDADMASARGSPAPSLYSFHSSLDGHVMLRDLHGRVLNSSNELYMLPADGEEHDRLDLQHAIYTLCLGSLYPARDSVKGALAPRQYGVPAILDVGTGSGSWAVAMAREFPHCEVVGVDLAPVRLASPMPINCRFEIDDANLGFAHYHGCFDVVHARAVGGGIRDYPSLLYELAAVVRPGGMLLFADGEMQLYDENQQPLPVAQPGDEAFSWTQRVFHATYNSMKGKGSQVDTPAMLPLWLSRMDELEDVGSLRVFIPVGPWRTGDAREEALSDMLRTNALMHIAGMRPLLLSEGDMPHAVDSWIAAAHAELRDLTVRLYSRWSFAWARKK